MIKIYWYETGVLSTAKIGNPQILGDLHRRKAEEIKAEAEAIASGQIRNPLEVVREKYGNAVLTATGRKTLDAFNQGRVIKATTLREQAAALEAAYQAQQSQIEADRIQAEQRARAGAVGARSEAIKQQEQRATTPVQSVQQPSNESYLYKVKLNDSAGVSSGIGGSVSRTPVPQSELKVSGGNVSTKTKSSFVLLGSPPQVAELREEKTFVTGKGVPFGPPKPEGKEPLESAFDSIEDASRRTRKGPLAPLAGPAIGSTREVLSAFGSLVNLERLGGEQFVKLFSGTKPIVKQVEIPKTFGGELVGGVVKSGTSLVTGAPQQAPLDLGETGKNIKDLAKERGGFETLGEISAFVAPFGPSASPLKLKSFVIPLESGGSKPVRSLVTYGGKELISNVGKSFSRTPEAAVVKSNILDKVSLPKIVESFTERAGGGVELEFLGQTGSRVFSSEKVLSRLKDTGKLTSDDIKLISASKTIVQESKRVPQKSFRNDFSAQPFENIPPGKPTKTQLDFFKEKKITLEGSAIDIPSFLPEFAGKAGDFDVKVKSFLLAKKLAAENALRLNKAVEGTNLEFVAQGGKIQLFERQGAVRIPKGKVGEFLAPDDPESIGQISKSGKVFDVKTSQKTIKIEGVKTKTLKFQLNRRAASVSSFQLTPEGIVKVGPPNNPPGTGPVRIKDFPRLYAGAKTSAFLFTEKGNFAKARKIDVAAEEIKRIGEKELDFGEFFNERRLTESFVQSPSALDRLSNSINRFVETPNNISPTITISKIKDGSPPTSLDRSNIARNIDKGSPIPKQTSKNLESSINSSVKNQNRSNISRLNTQSRSSISSNISNNTSVSKSPFNNRSPLSEPIINSRLGSVSKLPLKSIIPKSVIPVTGSPFRGTTGGPPGKPPGSPPSRRPARGPSFGGQSFSIAEPRLKLPLIKLKLNQTKRRKVPSILSKRLYIADPADPKRAGVIAPRGVSQLVSSKRSIFKTIDVKLAKARKFKFAIRPFGI